MTGKACATCAPFFSIGMFQISGSIVAATKCRCCGKLTALKKSEGLFQFGNAVRHFVTAHERHATFADYSDKVNPPASKLARVAGDVDVGDAVAQVAGSPQAPTGG